MSQKDVDAIRTLFQRTVGNMTNAGERADPPSQNNWEITKYRFTLGRAGHDFRGCWDQSNFVKSVFEGLPTLEDEWTFESAAAVFLDPRGDRFPIHHWFEGRSANPSDPVVVVDPWRNAFDTHPVPATTPTPDPQKTQDLVDSESRETRDPQATPSLPKLPGYPNEKHQVGPNRCPCGMIHPNEHAKWDLDCKKAPPCWCEDGKHCGAGVAR